MSYGIFIHWYTYNSNALLIHSSTLPRQNTSLRRLSQNLQNCNKILPLFPLSNIMKIHDFIAHYYPWSGIAITSHETMTNRKLSTDNVPESLSRCLYSYPQITHCQLPSQFTDVSVIRQSPTLIASKVAYV